MCVCKCIHAWKYGDGQHKKKEKRRPNQSWTGTGHLSLSSSWLPIYSRVFPICVTMAQPFPQRSSSVVHRLCDDGSLTILQLRLVCFFFCYRGTNQPRDGVRGPFGFHLQQAAFIFHLLLLNQLRFSQSSRGPSFLLNTCDSLSTSLCTSGSPIPSPWAFPFLSV